MFSRRFIQSIQPYKPMKLTRLNNPKNHKGKPRVNYKGLKEFFIVHNLQLCSLLVRCIKDIFPDFTVLEVRFVMNVMCRVSHEKVHKILHVFRFEIEIAHFQVKIVSHSYKR
jgi:hypothetical protein